MREAKPAFLYSPRSIDWPLDLWVLLHLSGGHKNCEGGISVQVNGQEDDELSRSIEM